MKKDGQEKPPMYFRELGPGYDIELKMKEEGIRRIGYPADDEGRILALVYARHLIAHPERLN